MEKKSVMGIGDEFFGNIKIVDALWHIVKGYSI